MQNEATKTVHRNSLGFVVSDSGQGWGDSGAKIVWGRREDGTRVSIEDAKRGGAEHLKCECGADLVARKGETNTHHFAHASGGAQACRQAQLAAMCSFALAALAGKADVRLPDVNGRSRSMGFDTVTAEVFGELAGVRAAASKIEIRREVAIVFMLKHRQPLSDVAEFEASGLSVIAINLAPHRNLTDEQIAMAIRSGASRHWLYNAKLPETAIGPSAKEGAGRAEPRARINNINKSRIDLSGASDTKSIITDDEWKSLGPEELRKRLFGAKYER